MSVRTRLSAAFADGERVLKRVTQATATIPGIALVAIFVGLVVVAWPAIRLNGFGFFTRNTWQAGSQYSNPVTTHGIAHQAGSSFGALPLITGTLESSAIAIVIGIPLALGVALAIDRLPRRLSSAVGVVLEVLAGIPSVVYGLWGAFALGPILGRHVEPFISNHVPDVPPFRFLKASVFTNQGLFVSGVVLAIMIVPIIAATSRDLFAQVPRSTTEGATALGLTELETTRIVRLRWVRNGIIGACVLGLGRALGETMAVAMTSGAILGSNATNLYSSMTTIAATIVSQLDSALTDATGFSLATLAEASLLLITISLAANIVARVLVRRAGPSHVPVGAGD